MLLESGLVDEVDVDKCLQQAQEAYHQNHFASSTQICKTLLTAQPDNVLALHQLGLVELAKGKIGEAISYFNRVVALDASMFQSTYNLGLCYHQLNNLDKAQAYYAKTLDANPEFVEAYNNLGIVHQYLGNHQKALELFKEAIRLQPDFVEAYYNASQCHDTAYNRSLLGNIKAFCDDPRLSSANRARAWFMRASILENQGEYAASMEAYQHANRLIHTPFNHTRFEQEIDAFIQFFTPEHLRKFSRPKFNSERYIFVVGMPRSGTSLIEQILSSHPHVAGIGEANHIQHLAVEITQGSAHTLIDAISSISPYTPLRSALDTLVLQDGKSMIVDKSITNFFYLGLIKLVYPNSRVVHIARNPLDNCLSCFCHHFSSSHNYTTSLKSLGQFYRSYARLMKHWHSVFGEEIHSINYEELVNNQEVETRRLLEYCGLDFRQECMDFHLTQRPVRSASHWGVKQRLSNKSIGKWKKFEPYLEELKQILETVQPSL